MANERPDRSSNGGTPEIGRDLHPRAPLLRRIERNERQTFVRRALRAALVAGGLAAAGAAVGVGWAVFGTPSSSSSSDSPSGPCLPQENHLDCLDRLHDEEVDGHSYPAVLPGLDTDGCVLLSDADQLRSPLCCPGISPNPADCPRPMPGMGLSVEGGKAVILDADDLVP
ncbi:hypothetical protein HYW83_05250 [Candidatus Peregrinibacteria bacterium]|nr:hypothetical protein [Candidatus Peregrinibacteria bacterium]